MREEIKVGDWVYNYDFHDHFQSFPIYRKVKEIKNGYIDSKIGVIAVGNIKKWIPQRGEVCVFWNDGQETRCIEAFRLFDKLDGYVTKEHTWYDNISPVTFDLSVYD